MDMSRNFTMDMNKVYDSTPGSNTLINQAITDGYKVHLDELAIIFRVFAYEKVVKLYTRELLKMKVTVNQLASIKEDIIISGERFPLIKDLKVNLKLKSLKIKKFVT